MLVGRFLPELTIGLGRSAADVINKMQLRDSQRL